MIQVRHHEHLGRASKGDQCRGSNHNSSTGQVIAITTQRTTTDNPHKHVTWFSIIIVLLFYPHISWVFSGKTEIKGKYMRRISKNLRTISHYNYQFSKILHINKRVLYSSLKHLGFRLQHEIK